MIAARGVPDDLDRRSWRMAERVVHHSDGIAYLTRDAAGGPRERHIAARRWGSSRR
jgi:hypothetical protein